MYKKLVLLIFLFCHISACSVLHGNSQGASISSNEISSTLNDSDDSSSVYRFVAFPFYAIGVVMMGVGGLFFVSADSENSETESRSDVQNGLLGLGLLAGGAVLWAIGDSIEE